MAAMFADNVSKCILFKEQVWLAIRISSKFVPKGPIDHKSALVQVMAKHRTGNKPLSELMLIKIFGNLFFFGVTFVTEFIWWFPGFAVYFLWTKHVNNLVLW